MKSVTLHLEMSDADAGRLLDEAETLANSDEVCKIAVDIKPSYTAYHARVLAIGSVPA